MRPFIFLLTSVLCASAVAATPENLEALPPPVLDADAPDEGPAVNITEQKDMTVEEFRSGGKLYMIKVTPKIGPPYYLVDDLGDGKFARHESLDSGLRVPRWILKKF
jgi:hypothetical protein